MRDWDIREVCEEAHLFALLASAANLSPINTSRAGTPSWAGPQAVWKRLLFPQRYNKKAKRGVGHERPYSAPMDVYKCVQALLTGICMAGRTPVQVNRSMGLCVLKSASFALLGDSSYNTVRVVHCVGSMPHLCLIKTSITIDTFLAPECAYGGIKQRWREDANMIQEVRPSRLLQPNVSSCVKRYVLKTHSREHHSII